MTRVTASFTTDSVRDENSARWLLDEGVRYARSMGHTITDVTVDSVEAAPQPVTFASQAELDAYVAGRIADGS